jgi:dienelactone hydrolase
MAEVLLFHHALGQTAGFASFADELRRAGNTVHAPDLYNGRTFNTLEDGMAYVKQVGFAKIIEQGVYPGKQHYFADSSLASYDAAATALLTRRVLDFLRSR